LTHSENLDLFISRYGESSDRLSSIIRDFPPDALRKWAFRLGFSTFIGSSGRVFPENRHPSALLRAWLARLSSMLPIYTRHRLIKIQRHPRLTLIFETAGKHLSLSPAAALLACGGASWPKSGSDGRWIELLEAHHVQMKSLVPANCGWRSAWTPDFIKAHEGAPLKNIRASAGSALRAGDLVITRYGIEGTPIYALTPELRKMAHPLVTLNLKPDLSPDALRSRLQKPPRNKSALLRLAARRWKLSPVAIDLLRYEAYPQDFEELLRHIHAFPLPLIAPVGMERAISSAGGITWDELSDGLMFKKIPGLFAAGEMIDWEAPTGGYLLQGCFATAYRSALGIDAYVRGTTP
jgi:uncharacterized flavoprotein (TIGR03862 family)